MKKLFLSILFLISLSAFSQDKSMPADYVNPFIGTGPVGNSLSGNNYPGATVPFGMVQLSPDTRTEVDWDYIQDIIITISISLVLVILILVEQDWLIFLISFSLWDTYRGAHPLYTILQPKRSEDFVRSLVRQYDTDGHMNYYQN